MRKYNNRSAWAGKTKKPAPNMPNDADNIASSAASTPRHMELKEKHPGLYRFMVRLKEAGLSPSFPQFRRITEMEKKDDGKI